MKGPFQVLVLGTGSHVGKSLITAGLCRLLADRGLRTAPFKAQNMALNSGVTPDGAEIGRAQLLQAQAARCLPRREMNPVLLKPLRGQGSQVIVMGKVVGRMSTRRYYRYWPQAARQARSAWQALAGDVDALVMEGAGSPAEVNLAHRDLANLEVARWSRAPWILVADIERGGSFAQVAGTLALVPAWLRRRLQGVMINKFRGDARLLQPGLAWLRRQGWTVLGVLPWLDGLVLDEEDSLGLPDKPLKSSWKDALKIEVIRHRFISNFNDILPLQAAGVDLRWVEPGQKTGRHRQPDLVVLPGSKDSLADLEALRQSGEASRIQRLAKAGSWVLGLCGGFQMLGQSVVDPGGADAGHRGGRAQGLGLLEVQTVMKPSKVLARTLARVRTAFGSFGLQGYQIHHGRSRVGRSCMVLAQDSSGQPLLVQGGPGGRVLGGYLHGLLEADGFRNAWLGHIARQRGRRFRKGPSLEAQREASLDRLARHLALHLDLRWLPQGAR